MSCRFPAVLGAVCFLTAFPAFAEKEYDTTQFLADFPYSDLADAFSFEAVELNSEDGTVEVDFELSLRRSYSRFSLLCAGEFREYRGGRDILCRKNVGGVSGFIGTMRDSPALPQRLALKLITGDEGVDFKKDGEDLIGHAVLSTTAPIYEQVPQSLITPAGEKSVGNALDAIDAVTEIIDFFFPWVFIIPFAAFLLRGGIFSHEESPPPRRRPVSTPRQLGRVSDLQKSSPDKVNAPDSRSADTTSPTADSGTPVRRIDFD